MRKAHTDEAVRLPKPTSNRGIIMANTPNKGDGHTRLVTEADLVVGAVLRMVNSDGSIAPFSDCVLTSVAHGVAKLARAHASGVECFEVVALDLCFSSNWAAVTSARGALYKIMGKVRT